jgi:Ca2+-binding RTX toxin-like protein
VDLVPSGGGVHVEAGVHGNYSVGTKLLTLAFQDGSSISQQADSLDPTLRTLVVLGTGDNDTIKFEPGSHQGVRVEMNDLPRGTFRPNGRLMAFGWEGSDNIAVSDDLHLSAWLFGSFSGNNRLKGGGGNDVLQGGDGDETLIGGGGRDLLIGDGGADHLEGRSGDDILIGGFWTYSSPYYYDEIAVAAILAEWTSDRDYDTRVNNLVNGEYPLTPGATLYDDGYVNVLTGGAGRDVFFASLIDVITDRKPNEALFLL